MDDAAGLTIRLSPQIEAQISASIDSLTNIAWYALAAVIAAAAVYVCRALNGVKP